MEDMLYSAVESDFAEEFGEILAQKLLKSHEEALRAALSQKPVNFRLLFSYGVDALEATQERPDPALATFFLVVSSLRGLPNELDDLATDAMVFCREDADYVKPTDRDEIIQRYKDCAPN